MFMHCTYEMLTIFLYFMLVFFKGLLVKKAFGKFPMLCSDRLLIWEVSRFQFS